ncbi:hypothetical protein PWT90_02513 [Aphanocladium album]|nr:hypothetical protein PWT90_02513 [Aphanocladium album]
MSDLKGKEWAHHPQQSFHASPDAYHVAYKRAKSLCLSSVNITRDISASIAAQIHLNLCVGTIGAHVADRPDLVPLLDDLMAFRTCASFLLTEFGHGLDVKNMETTATLLPDGSFDLHTPSPAAAKAMPPTAPLTRCPRIAVVLARLVTHNGEQRGFKLFLVPLASASSMYPGVTAQMMPVRPGTTPLDHCLTSFDRVRLPASALLGDPARASDPGLDLHRLLWRVSVGAVSLTLGSIACLRVGAYIAGTYSKRRCVEQAGHGLVPIISFSTQYRPVLRALVAGEVLSTFAHWTTAQFSNPALDMLHHARARRSLRLERLLPAQSTCRLVPVVFRKRRC